jgi:hypothetical protein
MFSFRFHRRYNDIFEIETKLVAVDHEDSRWINDQRVHTGHRHDSTNFAMIQWNHFRIAIVRRWLNNDKFSFPRIYFLKNGVARPPETSQYGR